MHACASEPKHDPHHLHELPYAKILGCNGWDAVHIHVYAHVHVDGIINNGSFSELLTQQVVIDLSCEFICTSLHNNILLCRPTGYY